MPVIFAIVAAVMLLYVLVLKDLEPQSKAKPNERESYNPLYFFVMLGLMILPVLLTAFVIWWNQTVIQNSFDAINIHILVFSWNTLIKLVWLVCGLLAAGFYIYAIFVKRYWLLILAIFLQVIVFIGVFLVWMVFLSPLDIFDSVEVIEEREYQLVQTSTLGNGRLYLFVCEGSVCKGDEIIYTDSFDYYDVKMIYNPESHTLTIYAKFREDHRFSLKKEIKIPLSN